MVTWGKISKLCPVPQSRPCGFGQSLGRPIVQSISPFFWSTKKNLFSLREFLVMLWFFWSTKFLFGIPKFLFSIPKNQSLTKISSETDQKFPETEQFFFGQPKKVRNRLDNWSTKRLTKTTWTGLMLNTFYKSM